jgi:sulfur relay (sulfurtransferase) DsrC/TusE family protein
MINNKQHQQKNLYLDLDAVVADWESEYTKLLTAHEAYKEENGHLSDKLWQRVREESRFYLNLPLMPGANELVNWAKEYTTRNNMRLAFLSAIPHNNDMQFAIYDKVNWCEKHFPGIPVFFGPYSIDKQTHCKLGDILIDDRHSNCQEWRQAGGIAHQYTNWATCQKWITRELPPV